MKTRTKTLLLLVCAVLLVATSVMGTLAYLTSKTEEVKNTFTIGKVAITLDETKVGEDGRIPKDDNNTQIIEKVTANEYHIIPGKTFDKDPTIHVDEKSEDCWVFAKIIVNNKADLDAIFAKYSLKIGDVVGGINSNLDVITDGKANSDTREYLVAVKSICKAKDEIKIFETITIPGDLTNEEIESLSDLEIDISAYAIQAEGFDDYTAAWTALEAQMTK